MTIAREEHKNKMVIATMENGTYTVRAFQNGRMVGRLDTEDKNEAMEVYGETAYAMYK